MLSALLWLAAVYTAGLTIAGFREIGRHARPLTLGDVLVSTACNVACIVIIVVAALELS